jgi:DNA-binding NarL/FixJ family response regulator
MTSCPGDIRTVYLVEDSPALAERLRTLLEELGGVRVVGQAAGARDAIRGIGELTPDVIVLDLRLSDGSGFDVLKAVKRQGGGARVIVLTNHDSPSYRKRAVQAGADVFLDKSTEFHQLAEAILSSRGPEGPAASPPKP